MRVVRCLSSRWQLLYRRHAVDAHPKEAVSLLSLFRAAVPFWAQTTQNLCDLYLKRDCCSPKRVNTSDRSDQIRSGQIRSDRIRSPLDDLDTFRAKIGC